VSSSTAGGTATAGRSPQPDEELPIDRLRTLIGYVPVGLEQLVGTAIGPRARRLPVIPAVLILLVALTVIPVSQALVEIIVRPVTVAEIVDRRVGLSTQLVKVDGLALLLPLDAEPPADGSDSRFVYHWYAVRDGLQELQLVMVRSVVAPESLRTRTIVARVVDDPQTLERTKAGVAPRRGDYPEDVAPVLLLEVDPRGQDVTQLGSLADLDGVAPGRIVRLTVRFDAGIASCVGRGDCRARSLANGIGSWDNLASDERGGWAVVRTQYPPSVAPFHGVGHHAQDRELVGELLALPLVRGLLEWGHVLQAAYVEHDLGLPIDHLWLGPIIFTLLGALILLGLRLGYPRFSSRSATPGWASAGSSWSGAVACRASGRITPPNASPFEVEDAPATLRSDPSRDPVLTVEVDGGEREVLVPRNLGGLGTIEFGDLLTVRSAVSALRIGWFGSNVQLVFSDPGSRDAAAAMVRSG
jgi:hypothetical protein